MLAREGDVWMVSLAGRDGEQPPLELDEYRAWARTLATPEIADAIDTLVPLDEGVRYRFPANRRRHYERLPRLPGRPGRRSATRCARSTRSTARA